MAEGRPNSRLNPIPCGEDRSFLSYTTGKAMAPQASPYFVHLSLVCEREIETGKMMQIAANTSPIRAGREAHLVETMFYDE